MEKFKNIGECLCFVLYFLSMIIFGGTLGFAYIQFNFSFLSLLIFILFLIVYIQIPGSFIKDLFKIDLKNFLSNAVLGFILGLAILFFQYYLFNFIHVIKFINIVNPIISVIWISKCIKYSKLKKSRITSIQFLDLNTAIIVFLSSIAFFTSMLRLQFEYINPEEASIINIGQDFIWHLGNINALSKEGLPIDPRVFGLIFEYHYFSDLILGICKYITGLAADIQLFSLSPVLITYLVVGAFYAFAIEFIPSQRYRHAFVFISLFTSVALYIVIANNYSMKSMYLDHIFTNVNAVGFSISTFLIGTVVISQFIKNMKPQLTASFIAVMVMIIFICTGMKGPFAAVLVAGLVATSGLLFIKRDNGTKRFLIFTLIVSIVFGLIYLLLLSSPAGGGGVNFSFTDTIERSALGVVNKKQSIILSLIMIICEFILLFNIFAILFIIVGWKLIVEIFKLKNLSHEVIIKWFMLASTIIGCGGFFLLNQSGLSQVYFLFCVIPFIQLFAFEYVINSEHKWIKICFLIAIMIGVGINGCDTVLEISRIYPKLMTTKEEQIDSEWMLHTINSDEYEALLWIRENTPIDAVFISNRQSLNSDRISDEFLNNRFFYYSAYSDRNFFLEGFSYSAIDQESLEAKKDVIQKIFYSKDELKYALLKENQIDYIIEAKINSQQADFLESGITKCFENESVVIYRVD